ncbi:MAG: flavin reductase family protein [Alphaproteobacteria bacterium]|nr:flavin reductase family protein [Alphaproteobacteria bacterium]MBQ3234593.1 flavin reductase family protein [Clostridia bacterium]
MRKNLKPKAYIYPLPVLIIGTYDENGVPNAMNAAWGTVCDSQEVSICLSSDHKTVKNLLKTKEFTVAMADVSNVIPADYVGVVSGNDVVNKIEKAGWHAVKGEVVNAPVFEELPLVLECKLKSYNFDTEIAVGEVVNVSASESILTGDKVDLNKFKPIAYDCENYGYYALGEKVGQAFSDGLKIK